ncbi:ubiquinone biosynthesis protein COQ7-domain-containing protein [Schizothecium vesticola]|uniref:5-demethoxyubiquinone hydroxylase, mitochondrial n=1 Tax=Schizothecium vesticola TaxID=314040 RepID=A0AA40EP12_9PEZI|nr:ubiquinone biosynthesis protein COQ7-domain-containing protein [Schizothecium vesticola]
MPRPLLLLRPVAAAATSPKPATTPFLSLRRHLSTTPHAAATTTNPPNPASPSPSRANPSPRTQLKPPLPLTPSQTAFLSSLLRVNQAGELAATLIYTSQTPPLVTREPHLRPLLAHMLAQEASHLSTFNTLLAKHRVRPTALYPLWSVLASGLGWSTAVLSREAAMACTEAVETEIGGHYNGQIRVLLEMVEGWERAGHEVGEEFRGLVETLRRIRDEELEHLDQAVEHDAQKAEPHWLLTGVIRAGCRGAIWVSERV